MKAELTDIDAVKKTLEVEAEPAELEQETERVLKGYRAKARIPGFRQGKAPLSIIRTRFASEVEEDVRERLVGRLFYKAAEERNLKPISEPVLEEVSREPGQPLRFKATFEVAPEIDLKDYKGVEVRRPKISVADEELDKAIEELRQSRVQFVHEEGREAVTGDVVVADVAGTPETGEPFSREHMQLEVGATNNLPAFNDALLGATAGADLEFPVEYPKEYKPEQLAGQTVQFQVTVHEVKRRHVPQLDDEFAKDLGGDFEDLAGLRERVREDLEARKNHEADRSLRQAVLDKILLVNPVVLPDSLVESEIRRRLEDLVRNLMMQGVDPEQSEIDWKQMRAQQEEPARRAVHAQLVLDALAETESLEIDDEAVSERIGIEAQRMGEEPGKLRARIRKQGGEEALKTQMLREKSLDYVTSVANIQNEE